MRGDKNPGIRKVADRKADYMDRRFREERSRSAEGESDTAVFGVMGKEKQKESGYIFIETDKNPA